MSSVQAQSGDGNSPVQQDKIQLQREVGLFSAVNLIIGVMIGNWSIINKYRNKPSISCKCCFLQSTYSITGTIATRLLAPQGL